MIGPPTVPDRSNMCSTLLPRLGSGSAASAYGGTAASSTLRVSSLMLLDSQQPCVMPRKLPVPWNELVPVLVTNDQTTPPVERSADMLAVWMLTSWNAKLSM